MGNAVLADLIYGWGNSWSAQEEYLVCCIQHALNSSGPILECGSGLSTILIGVIAQRRGYQHWALEHNPKWARRVQRYLNRYNVDSVKLCVKPLKDYGEYLWYDPPVESMPPSFEMVVCDGPPGKTKGGRYGLVPVIKEKLRPGCIILLDDASREQELAIAKKWGIELSTSYIVHGEIKPYIELRVNG
jgi:predicted O-methyltransferase YrrM